MIGSTLLLALLLDKILGEPKRGHPLVIYGRLVNFVEIRLNQGAWLRLKGLVAVLVVWVPFVTLAGVIEQSIRIQTGSNGFLLMAISALFLYLAIGWRSLIEHAKNIENPLANDDLESARRAVSMIVSRDTQNLSETEIASAATESVLENGADAIFSAIFWFCILGIPGVVLYRLSNTLDAMWGYKNDQFLQFGWAAARLDDLLNYIPARLTALTYALVGNTRLAFQCWKQQGYRWKSPNAGPVMASGAGAINVSLGGSATYHDHVQQRPDLGPDIQHSAPASADTINKACNLVNRALLLWVVVIILVDFLI